MFMQKVQPNPTSSGLKYTGLGDTTIASSAPIQYVETKLCWSEYRNGKWTQKQVSGDALYENYTASNYSPPKLSQYLFVPRIQDSDESTVSIDVFRNSGNVGVGRFDFINGTFILSGSPPSALSFASDSNNTPESFFQYNTAHELHSWQANTSDPLYRSNVPFVRYPQGLSAATVQVVHSDPTFGTTQDVFFHQFSHKLLGRVDNSNSLNKMFDFYTNLGEDQLPDAFGLDPNTNSYNELKSPYAIYNWELTFHAPMALVYQFRVSKQYDKALAALQSIFDPFLNFPQLWKFRPFQKIAAYDYLETFFQSLRPNTENPSITEWRNNPFSPHVIARCSNLNLNLTNLDRVRSHT
jgi:hypothetical protein